jgi:hypothetical protein
VGPLIADTDNIELLAFYDLVRQDIDLIASTPDPSLYRRSFNIKKEYFGL